MSHPYVSFAQLRIVRPSYLTRIRRADTFVGPAALRRGRPSPPPFAGARAPWVAPYWVTREEEERTMRTWTRCLPIGLAVLSMVVLAACGSSG